MKKILFSVLSLIITTQIFSQGLPCKASYESNRRCKERYKEDGNGNIHGKYIRYSSDGEREVLANFNHGNLYGEYEGTVSFILNNKDSGKDILMRMQYGSMYENSVIKTFIDENGRFHGYTEESYTARILFIEKTFKKSGKYNHGKKVGEWKDCDGGSCWIGSYVDNKKNGVWIYNNPEGDEAETLEGYNTTKRVYENGKLIREFNINGEDLAEVKRKEIEEKNRRKAEIAAENARRERIEKSFFNASTIEELTLLIEKYPDYEDIETYKSMRDIWFEKIFLNASTPEELTLLIEKYPDNKDIEIYKRRRDLWIERNSLVKEIESYKINFKKSEWNLVERNVSNLRAILFVLNDEKNGYNQFQIYKEDPFWIDYFESKIGINPLTRIEGKNYMIEIFLSKKTNGQLEKIKMGADKNVYKAEFYFKDGSLTFGYVQENISSGMYMNESVPNGFLYLYDYKDEITWNQDAYNRFSTDNLSNESLKWYIFATYANYPDIGLYGISLSNIGKVFQQLSNSENLEEDADFWINVLKEGKIKVYANTQPRNNEKIVKNSIEEYDKAIRAVVENLIYFYSGQEQEALDLLEYNMNFKFKFDENKGSGRKYASYSYPEVVYDTYKDYLKDYEFPNEKNFKRTLKKLK